MSSDASPSNQNVTSFEERETRITKHNLYMVLALWMEKFPDSQLSKDESTPTQSSSQSTKSSPPSQPPKTSCETESNKVGVVFVLPKDRVLSVDCSRDDVHGIARVIMKHCDKVEGCQVFVSRKPCSICTKLLVQSKVSRVFYLPIEPESTKEEELEKVDHLFKVSPVAQSMFVPVVEEDVLSKEERKRPAAVTPDDVKQRQGQLFEAWWGGEKNLKLPVLDDKVKNKIEQDFKSLMKWIAAIEVPLYKQKMKFYKICIDNNLTVIPEKDEMTEFPGGKVGKHMIIFAKMLARQTDDPKTGVGAILMKGNEIVGLGWNGFPSKTLYAEFPRASDDDDAVREKKYPYVIHAEQNALMNKSEKDLTDGILFVTKCPCDECAPLVKLSGVTTIVVGEDLTKSKGGNLSYKKVKEYIRDYHGQFTCIEMRTADRSSEASHSSARKKLKFDKKRETKWSRDGSGKRLIRKK